LKERCLIFIKGTAKSLSRFVTATSQPAGKVIMRPALTILFPLLFLAACAAGTAGEDHPVYYGKVQVPSARVVESKYPTVAEGLAAEHAGVPVEYIPPKGFCRIWYPERPATTQPDVGSCKDNVPSGAIMIRR
jgi:hypothetical protein